MTKVITICSGKGGVGKTTTSANLAAALHLLGKDVTIVDANVTTPNLGLHLGIYEVPKTLHDVLQGKATLSEATYLHPIGFKVVPSSLNVNVLNAKMRKTLRRVLDKSSHNSDFVIIDSSPGLGKEARLAIEAGDEVLIVTNPEMPAIVDALKTIKMAEKSGTKITGVVLNRVSGNNEMSIKNAEHFLDSKVIEVIPEDKRMKLALRRREPLVVVKPYSKASRAYRRLAMRLAGYEVSSSFLDSLKSKFGFI